MLTASAEKDWNSKERESFFFFDDTENKSFFNISIAKFEYGILHRFSLSIIMHNSLLYFILFLKVFLWFTAVSCLVVFLIICDQTGISNY